MSPSHRAPSSFLAHLAGILAVLLLAPAAAHAQRTAPEIRESLSAARLEAKQARRVEGLVLRTGVAVLTLDDGVLFPAVTPDGDLVEMVFVGSGTVELDAPDDVEAAQLELFTGAARLEETFSEAVFVIARDDARAAILGRPVDAAAGAGEAAGKASARYDRWRDSTERRILDVETGILLDALGDPLNEHYFAAWFQGDALGEFLLLVEPDAEEQVSLGQFVPFELTDKEKRKIEKRLHAEERRGRRIAQRVQDLGTFDDWMSTRLVDSDGKPFGGVEPFAPKSYRLDVRVDPGELTVAGRAALTVEAVSGLRRVVTVSLPSAFEVSSVLGGDGAALDFFRAGDSVHVVLPEAPARGETVSLEMDYGGVFLERGGERNWTLASSVDWHPHVGYYRRADYDVTLRWPKKFDLLAAGNLQGAGEDGDWSWERRTLPSPSFAFGFEIGRYKTVTGRGGRNDRVEIVLAVDQGMQDRSKRGAEELVSVVGDALTYYEEVFGPYPLDRMVVVTVPRSYSQSLFGFMTLSNFMMIDWDELGFAGLSAFLGFEDRRTVIAHEVAHQWWGHLLGFRSYRDVWWTEAMANYAAGLWARNRLPAEERPTVGPTTGWRRTLTASLEDGRPVEALGPVVLGPRLNSSRGAGYNAIVYQKGALVLNMLARGLGEERFLTGLRTMFERLGGRDLTTADLLTALEHLSGVPLEGFGRQYVYGTGLPEVYYDYRFEDLGGGRHKVFIDARQETAWRYRHEVVAVEGGGLDVRRSRLDQTEVAASTVPVPVRIVLADEGGGRKKDQTTRYLNGQLVLEGEHTTTEFELPHEPAEVWLDAEQEVFGRFFNRRHHPKRVRYFEGLDQAAAGRAEEAAKLFQEALAATTPVADTADKDARRAVAVEDRLLDARIHAGLARLHLDAGRLDAAAASLRQAEDAVKGGERWLVEDLLGLLEARHDLLSGDTRGAFRKLRKEVLKRGDLDSAESWLLLAIAAKAEGETDVLTEALEKAKGKGADAGALAR